MARTIIQIDENRCDGCGLCAQACEEGALAIIDGVAKLIKEEYCDGLGNCLPACPQDAITLAEREAAPFQTMPLKQRRHSRKKVLHHHEHHAHNHREQDGETLACGCSKKSIRSLSPRQEEGSLQKERKHTPGALSQWPVQIKLLPATASFYQGADVLIAADCTAYAYADFHRDFIQNRITLVGCPKLDDIDYSEKLTEIFTQNDIKSVTLTRMTVPCCGGMEKMVKTALKAAGKQCPLAIYTISAEGEIENVEKF